MLIVTWKHVFFLIYSKTMLIKLTKIMLLHFYFGARYQRTKEKRIMQRWSPRGRRKNGKSIKRRASANETTGFPHDWSVGKERKGREIKSESQRCYQEVPLVFNIFLFVFSREISLSYIHAPLSLSLCVLNSTALIWKSSARIGVRAHRSCPCYI